MPQNEILKKSYDDRIFFDVETILEKKLKGERNGLGARQILIP
jgi:hypothetical protein